MDSKQLIGWFQAFFTVLVLWSVSNVFLGFSIRTFGCHPIVYSCVVFTSASLTLLMYAGHGKLAKETMHSVDTWGYGIFLMLNYIVLLALLSMTTSTETTLLQSIAVVVSLVSGWFFMSRSVSLGQILGSVIILLGLVLTLSDLAVEKLGQIVLLVLAMGGIQTIRTYIAEFHRPHKFASNHEMSIKDRARVISLVMFVVSTLFFVSFLGFAVLMYFVQGVHIPAVPLLGDFLNPYTTILGMIAGVILIAPLRFFEFSATAKIKTENYLAVSAFAPIATWFWEWASSPLTGIDMRELSMTDAYACLFITAGGLLMAFSRMKKDVFTASDVMRYLKKEIQSLEEVADSYEVVKSTVEHFSGDLDKSSEVLLIPVQILTLILEDKGTTLSFKPDVFKEVARRFRRGVAQCDALTGLANRGSFMMAMGHAPYEANIFSVIFVDLDKFKPVNDTYGHEAGDFVLVEVAQRLNALFTERSLVSRLGGDEFCIMLLDATKADAQKRMAEIEEAMKLPFVFNAQVLDIGASLGVASYPEDSSDIQSLIKLADEGMYVHKKER